ncbi:MAG: hypothetical protein JSU89_11145, partial [Myxococcales bacterium]
MCRARSVLAVLVLTLASCTSEPQSDDQTRRGSARTEEGTDEAAKREPISRNYDAEGRLLPSNDYIVGIRLPRGAQLFREDELVHVYRIRAPIDKVLAYFGP